jgi:P27 family predicted phage terminase small subunit
MPGPPPKPTAIKILEGRRGHHPLNDREPTPLVMEPEMPKHLDAIARREWRRLVPILISMRVLTEADGIALASLCSAYSTLIQTQSLIRKQEASGKSPLLMRTNTGYVYQSPLLAIVNTQIGIINRLLVEFGLTPASRTRISVAGRDSSSDALDDAVFNLPVQRLDLPN